MRKVVIPVIYIQKYRITREREKLSEQNNVSFTFTTDGIHNEGEKISENA